MGEPLSLGPRAWLRNSLKHHSQAHRKLERDCRRAYTKGEMLEAATRLANAHARSAEAFEAALADNPNEPDPKGGDRG